MAKDLIVSLLDGKTHDRTVFDCGEPALNDYPQTVGYNHLIYFTDGSPWVGQCPVGIN